MDVDERKLLKTVFSTKKHKQSVVNYYIKIAYICVYPRESAANSKFLL